jgi:predicted transcriptional regulator
LEFVQELESLGVNRNVASLITYLKEVKEGSSRDIEMATGLRQPEVSIAMRTLRERDGLLSRRSNVREKAGPRRSTPCDRT